MLESCELYGFKSTYMPKNTKASKLIYRERCAVVLKCFP